MIINISTSTRAHLPSKTRPTLHLSNFEHVRKETVDFIKIVVHILKILSRYCFPQEEDFPITVDFIKGNGFST